jgi:fibronectin-binding autotransporter adhesin
MSMLQGKRSIPMGLLAASLALWCIANAHAATIPTANLMVQLDGTSVAVSGSNQVQVWYDQAFTVGNENATQQDFGVLSTQTANMPTLTSYAFPSGNLPVIDFNRQTTGSNNSSANSDYLESKLGGTARATFGGAFTAGADTAYNAINSGNGISWFVVFQTDLLSNVTGSTTSARQGLFRTNTSTTTTTDLWGSFVQDTGGDTETLLVELNAQRRVVGGSAVTAATPNISSQWYIQGNTWEPLSGAWRTDVFDQNGAVVISQTGTTTAQTAANLGTHNLTRIGLTPTVITTPLGTNSAALDGKIAEILVYDTALDATGLTAVTDYLKDKYFSLNLPANTLIWDADAPTAGAQDGSGTWGAAANWWNGKAPQVNQAWIAGYTAVIGNGGPAGSGAVGTVTVDPVGVTLGGLKLQPINPSADGTYEITGGALNFTSGAVIMLNQPRDQTAPLTSGVNEYSRIFSNVNGANLTFASEISAPGSLNQAGWVQLRGTNNNLTGTLTIGPSATNPNNVAVVAMSPLNAATNLVINPASMLDLSYAGTVSNTITIGSIGPAGILPSSTNTGPTNAGGMRIGTAGLTTNFASAVTFTGDTEIQAGGAIVNMNSALNSNYHLGLRSSAGATMNVNAAVTAKSVQVFARSTSGAGSTVNVNAAIQAGDMIAVASADGSISINAPVTLNTTSGTGKFLASGTSSTTAKLLDIKALITAPGGIEFRAALNNVVLDNATGFALNTPEILLTPLGSTGATVNSQTTLVIQRNDQISHNTVVTFSGTGNNRMISLQSHTATLAGIQTVGVTTATQATIQNASARSTGTLIVEVPDSVSYTFAGRLQNGSGTGSLLAVVKRGQGTLDLQGLNVADHTGGLTVEAGTLKLDQATITNTSYKLTLSGGTVDFGSSYPSMGLFTITGGLASGIGYLTSSANYELQGGEVAVGLGGTVGVNKTGTGTAILSASNYYTGNTTISGGTLALTGSGSISSSAVIELQNSARLDVSGLLYLYQPLRGHGSVKGNVYDTTTAVVAPGRSASAGTLTFENNLSLTSASNLNFDLSPTAASGNDRVAVSGDLDLGVSNSLTINVGALGATWQTGTPYTVLTWSGSLLNAGTPPTLNVVEYTRYGTPTAVLDQANKQITLTVPAGAGPKTLTWAAAFPADWDRIGSFNWTDGSISEQFYDADAVNFVDGYAGTVNLTAPVRPSAITVNAAQDYEFAGTGSIGGAPVFTKTGAGTLTIGTANDFGSDLTLNGGTLKINNIVALGTTEGKTYLNNAVLDLNGLVVGSEEIVVGGTGGAKIANYNILNAIAGNTNIKFLTLNANVTVGGGAPVTPGPNVSEYRFDIRDPDGAGFLKGNGYKLTKVDANRVMLVDLGETHLGDIDIQAGWLDLVTDTTLGDQPGSVSVHGGAGLRFFNSAANYGKNIGFADTATLLVDQISNSTLSGAVTLSGGTVAVNVASTSTLTITGDVTGGGGLNINGDTSTGTLFLDGGKSYTGNTLVSAGTLALTGSGAIGSALITVNTSLNVLDGAHTVNAIGGAGTVSVLDGASLTATSISVNALNIGGSAAAASASAAAVPEPSAWLLLVIAGGLLAIMRKQMLS